MLVYNFSIEDDLDKLLNLSKSPKKPVVTKKPVEKPSLAPKPQTPGKPAVPAKPKNLTSKPDPLQSLDTLDAADIFKYIQENEKQSADLDLFS